MPRRWGVCAWRGPARPSTNGWRSSSGTALRSSTPTARASALAAQRAELVRVERVDLDRAIARVVCGSEPIGFGLADQLGLERGAHELVLVPGLDRPEPALAQGAAQLRLHIVR